MTSVVGASSELLARLIQAYADEPRPRAVAVVGNQPLPPDERRAKTIDSCDVVFRVNGFVCDGGGRPTVGSRTHVVVFNRIVRATPWLFHDYRSRLYLLVEPGRMRQEPKRLPYWWPHDLGAVPVSNREVTLPLSAALGLDTDTAWATTGTMAAWIARTTFPDAELYLSGFSFIDEPEQTSWRHASGDSCPVGKEHHIDREGRLLASWTETGSTHLLR